jgi:hypothetical protein
MDSASAAGGFSGGRGASKAHEAQRQKALKFTMPPLKNWYLRQAVKRVGERAILG